MYDSNEVFNTGYVEGDGGVMYIGASLTNGYGMHFRENFVHHSLEVPGLHGRGGIYFDDHMQAISNSHQHASSSMLSPPSASLSLSCPNAITGDDRLISTMVRFSGSGSRFSGSK